MKEKPTGNEERFRYTLDNMLEGVQIHDFNWRYTYVNDALVSYSKYSREELIGYTVMEKYPGIEQTNLFKVMQRCMQERVVERFETEFIFPDGSQAYFELSIQPVPEGIFILSIDITNRRTTAENLEKAVSQSKESLLKIFNASPSGMTINDIESAKLIEVNKSFLNTFGYKKEDLVGSTVAELKFVPDESGIPLFAKLKQQGYLKNEEIACYTKENRKIDCIVSVDLFEMEGNEYFLSIFHDISNIKEMERKVIESEQKFQKAFQASGAAISITRLSNGVYLDINEAFVQLTGYTKEEVIGYSSTDLGLVADIEKREAALEKIREAGSAKHFEITIRHKSGKLVEILSDVETILLNGERYAINIIYDITDRKRAEEQLEAVNKELEAFSYSISHDLRAPLRAINGYTKIIEDEYAKAFDEEGKRLLNVVQHNAKKMSTLIDDLLNFSKQGKKVVQKKNLDMNALFNTIISDLSKTTNYTGEIKLGDLHPAEGDHAMISQVIVNLISNAIKYSAKISIPVIEVTSELKNDEVEYTVKDNGDGFDMKYIDKLFGTFQRLHSSEEYEGTGVGLAIVQRIINKHGGKVWAEGEVGKGATFSFTLPAAK